MEPTQAEESQDSRTPHRVRVAVVDDHEMFRRGVIDTIAADCDVVGQAATVEEAKAKVFRMRKAIKVEL